MDRKKLKDKSEKKAQVEISKRRRMRAMKGEE